MIVDKSRSDIDERFWSWMNLVKIRTNHMHFQRESWLAVGPSARRTIYVAAGSGVPGEVKSVMKCMQPKRSWNSNPSAKRIFCMSPYSRSVIPAEAHRCRLLVGDGNNWKRLRLQILRRRTAALSRSEAPRGCTTTSTQRRSIWNGRAQEENNPRGCELGSQFRQLFTQCMKIAPLFPVPEFSRFQFGAHADGGFSWIPSQSAASTCTEISFNFLLNILE